MQINERRVTVRELADQYRDLGDEGVTGLSGNLDIRPAYQREFVYKDKDRLAVMDTLTRGLPLNVMYWAARDDETFEVMDGQQRTISICQYVNGDYSHNGRYFHNLTTDEQDQILNYTLLVYVCEGTESEKLDWFKTINIAGAELTEQELRNAVYHGPWLAAAKKWFSKTGGPAQAVGGPYVSGAPIRQELLERALKWVVLRDGLPSIEEYMGLHQHDPDAADIWDHYQRVVKWAQTTFPKPRKELKSVDWGRLYLTYGDTYRDPDVLEAEITRLMADDEVTKKAGVYEYLLSGDERHLSLRSFTPAQKREAFERQGGVCPNCQGEFSFEEMQGDHITPWSKGGKTVPDNCMMLCADCNRRKSNV